MKQERAIFDRVDPAADAAADARAEEDIAAGRTVGHEQVAAWLATWGTDEERPAPREWLAWSGRGRRCAMSS